MIVRLVGRATLKPLKPLLLGAVVVLAGLVPLSEASAWGYSGGGYHGGPGGGYHGGPWGGGYRGYGGGGYRGYGGGGYRGYGGGGYRGYGGGYRGPWGGYRSYGGYRGYGGYWGGGCWNCGAAGAAIVGLGIGALLGSVIATVPPPVVVGPPAPPPLEGCSSVVVNGIPYSNCGGYYPRYYGGNSGVGNEGWQSK